MAIETAPRSFVEGTVIRESTAYRERIGVVHRVLGSGWLHVCWGHRQSTNAPMCSRVRAADVVIIGRVRHE